VIVQGTCRTKRVSGSGGVMVVVVVVVVVVVEVDMAVAVKDDVQFLELELSSLRQGNDVDVTPKVRAPSLLQLNPSHYRIITQPSHYTRYHPFSICCQYCSVLVDFIHVL
jgi:hypothetical protein